MKKLVQTIILATCLGFGASAHASLIAFDLDGILSGSTESTLDQAFDCPPGQICKRKSRVRIGLKKQTSTFSFPTAVLIPAPPAPFVPIPFPNLQGSISVYIGDFLTDAGELATLTVEQIVDDVTFVSFDMVVESDSGYMLPSIPFSGQDADGNQIQRTLFLTSVPEPATLALFGIGLAGLGFARKKKKAS